jgi:hypothetical protein
MRPDPMAALRTSLAVRGRKRCVQETGWYSLLCRGDRGWLTARRGGNRMHDRAQGFHPGQTFGVHALGSVDGCDRLLLRLTARPLALVPYF